MHIQTRNHGVAAFDIERGKFLWAYFWRACVIRHDTVLIIRRVGAYAPYYTVTIPY